MASKKTVSVTSSKTADLAATQAIDSLRGKITIRNVQQYLQLGALVTPSQRVPGAEFKDRIAPVNGTIPIPRPRGMPDRPPPTGSTIPIPKSTKLVAAPPDQDIGSLLRVEAVDIPGSDLIAEVFVRFMPKPSA